MVYTWYIPTIYLVGVPDVIVIVPVLVISGPDPVASGKWGLVFLLLKYSKLS